jgi:hypothetical protein
LYPGSGIDTGNGMMALPVGGEIKDPGVAEADGMLNLGKLFNSSCEI